MLRRNAKIMIATGVTVAMLGTGVAVAADPPVCPWGNTPQSTTTATQPDRDAPSSVSASATGPARGTGSKCSAADRAKGRRPAAGRAIAARTARIAADERRRLSRGRLRMSQLVLLVEDELKIRELVRRYLEREGLEVLTTGSGAEAITMASDARPDLVVLDLGLPDVPGEEVARELRASSDGRS